MASNQKFNVEGTSTKIVLTGGMLVPGGGNIVINNATIEGLTDNLITDISLRRRSGLIYEYEVSLVGNTTVFGHWSCEFTDATNDTYKLRISSPTTGTHVVKFNSTSPNIVKIVLER